MIFYISSKYISSLPRSFSWVVRVDAMLAMTVTRSSIARVGRVLIRAGLKRRGHLPEGARPSRCRDESGSARTRRSPAPRPACSPCPRSSTCWLRASRRVNADALRLPRGTQTAPDLRRCPGTAGRWARRPAASRSFALPRRGARCACRWGCACLPDSIPEPEIY